jgi:predicted lipid-binding transport protein (Tim44 family)
VDSQNTSAIIQACILGVAILVIMLLCIRVVVKTISLSSRTSAKSSTVVPQQGEATLSADNTGAGHAEARRNAGLSGKQKEGATK